MGGATHTCTDATCVFDTTTGFPRCEERVASQDAGFIQVLTAVEQAGAPCLLCNRNRHRVISRLLVQVQAPE